MKFIPLCMTTDELVEWQRANRETHGIDRAKRPCDDCPASFAAEMRAQALCNGRSKTAPKHSAVRLAQWREAGARRRARLAKAA